MSLDPPTGRPKSGKLSGGGVRRSADHALLQCLSLLPVGDALSEDVGHVAVPVVRQQDDHEAGQAEDDAAQFHVFEDHQVDVDVDH